MAESKSDEFFPKIGEVAEKANALEGKDLTGQTKEDDDEDRPVEEIESLCMNCREQVRDRLNIGRGLLNDLDGCMQGVTKLLLTTIPYFKEVIIMSFRCEHCGTSNNEIQSAGSIRRTPTLWKVSRRHSYVILG